MKTYRITYLSNKRLHVKSVNAESFKKARAYIPAQHITSVTWCPA